MMSKKDIKEVKTPNDGKVIPYTPFKDLNEKKIKEYKSSKEWNELEFLFTELNSSGANPEKEIEVVLKILPYGEIAGVMFHEICSGIAEGDSVVSSFIHLPIYLTMPYELAVEVLKNRVLEGKENNSKLDQVFYDYRRDLEIEELIKRVEIGIRKGDIEYVKGILKSLYSYGEFALSRLKLVMINENTNPYLLSSIRSVIVFIVLGEEEAMKLINLCNDENKAIMALGRSEVEDIIDSIDPTAYLDRHPRF